MLTAAEEDAAAADVEATVEEAAEVEVAATATEVAAEVAMRVARVLGDSTALDDAASVDTALAEVATEAVGATA